VARHVDTADLETQLVWLRAATADPKLNTRLVLGGILDLLAALLDAPGPPGPPK
jgi:hypothetical protein